MSEKKEDLESTVRLETNIIADPYDDPTPPSIDSIEDLFNSDDFADAADVSFDLPEENIISPQGAIDFDDLTKEMNDLSSEFELNILEEEKVQVAVTEDKPTEKKVTEKVSNTTTKETSPKTATPKAKQDKISEPDTPPTDKKELKKTKEPAPISVTKKTTPHTNKSSNGISTAMLCLSLVALIAGLTGAWTSMSSQSQIDTLSAKLNVIQSNHSNNEPGFTAIQKQLISLKQELATLQLKHATSSLIKNEASNIIKPVKKLSPAVITPITPIKEVKPTLLKNTWNVIISSHDSMKKAKKEQRREAVKGMKTSIVAVVVKGKNWYRIVATGFVDKQQAVNFTHKLKQQGISDAWIQYNK